MSTVTHEGCLAIIRESFAMLREALGGLPDESLTWTPYPGTNSLAVLAMHSVTATRFFLKAGSGEPGDIMEYRSGDRVEAFDTRSATVVSLLAAIDQFDIEAEAIVTRARDRDLTAAISWPAAQPPIPARTGAGSLFATIGHLREHVGQAQMVREMWLAA